MTDSFGENPSEKLLLWRQPAFVLAASVAGNGEKTAEEEPLNDAIPSKIADDAGSILDTGT